MKSRDITSTSNFKDIPDSDLRFEIHYTEDPVAVCQNYTAFLDDTGNATITTANVDGGSTDDSC